MVGSIGTQSIDAEEMLVGPGAVANAGLKSYPELKESGVSWLGKVPAHWEVRRLRNVTELRVSNVDKHTREGETLVRLCNYVDVYKNDRIRSSMPFMAATATADELERFRLRSGDVLITKDSEAWDDIGVPALVQEVDDDVVSGYHLALLRSDAGHLNGEFLYRAVQNRGVAYQFHVRANGVTRYGLSHEAIKSVCLPVPPLAEQAAIVRFLDPADRRIRRYIRAKQKLITLLEEQKQAVIHRAVTRGLDPNIRLKPSGVKWLGDVPEHWEVVRLRNTSEMRVSNVDKHAKDDEQPVRLCNYVDVYKNDCIRSGMAFMRATATTDEIERFRLQSGDVLITKDSEAWNDIGVPALVEDTQDDIVSGYHLALLRPFPERVDGGYLFRALQSPAVAYQFHVEANGVTRYGLSHSAIRSVWLPLPPLSEQAAIVSFLDRTTAALDAATTSAQRETSLLREYHTRLIADVVTGKLDVREAVAGLPEVDPLAAEDDSDDGSNPEAPLSHGDEVGVTGQEAKA